MAGEHTTCEFARGALIFIRISVYILRVRSRIPLQLLYSRARVRRFSYANDFSIKRDTPPDTLAFVSLNECNEFKGREVR